MAPVAFSCSNLSIWRQSDPKNKPAGGESARIMAQMLWGLRTAQHLIEDLVQSSRFQPSDLAAVAC
jgi:hypothetical protein